MLSSQRMIHYSRPAAAVNEMEGRRETLLLMMQISKERGFEKEEKRMRMK